MDTPILKTANMKEYNKMYMRNYIKDIEKIDCLLCHSKFQKHRKYIHVKSKRHLLAIELTKTN
jgi:hypothetical protein